jgi:hypothetical protein
LTSLPSSPSSGLRQRIPKENIMARAALVKIDEKLALQAQIAERLEIWAV